MPSEAGTRPPATAIHVTVAPFVDFQFVLFLISKRPLRPDPGFPAWIARAEALNPELFRSLVHFWDGTGLADLPDGRPYVDWGELLVLSWQSRLLFSTDVAAAIDSIEAQIPQPFPMPDLPSEPRDVTDLIERRLAYLRQTPSAAARYVSMLREMWTIVEPQWHSAAATEAQAMAAELEARARTETDLRRLVPSNSFVHKDNYQPQIARARERGEVHIIPLVLGNEGTLYWTFPDALIIGVGPATPEKQARRRARLEDAASRFKVLSDPTRLSILNEVMHGGSHNATTVTELASVFGLSQPTISVHMKMLREAGLVLTERDGNRTLYTANGDTIRAFIDHAIEELMGSPATPPDC